MIYRQLAERGPGDAPEPNRKSDRCPWYLLPIAILVEGEPEDGWLLIVSIVSFWLAVKS